MDMDPKKKSTDIEGAVAKRNGAVKAATGAAMGQLPSEPIPAVTASTLVETLNNALDAIGGGQLESLKVAPVEGDLTAIPDDLSLGLTAMQTIFDKTKSGTPYRFKLDALDNEAGAREVTAALGAAAKDDRLIREVTAPKVAFAGDATNDQRKTGAEDKVAFAGDATNDQRKTRKKRSKDTYAFSDDHSTMTNI